MNECFFVKILRKGKMIKFFVRIGFFVWNFILYLIELLLNNLNFGVK